MLTHVYLPKWVIHTAPFVPVLLFHFYISSSLEIFEALVGFRYFYGPARISDRVKSFFLFFYLFIKIGIRVILSCFFLRNIILIIQSSYLHFWFERVTSITGCNSCAGRGCLPRTPCGLPSMQHIDLPITSCLLFIEIPYIFDSDTITMTMQVHRTSIYHIFDIIQRDLYYIM